MAFRVPRLASHPRLAMSGTRISAPTRCTNMPPTGTQLTSTFFNAYQPGLAVLGDVPGEQPLPPRTQPVYSFELAGGESASIALQGLNNSDVSFTLLDDNGDVLAYSSPGATNYTAGLNNFVSPDDETYYVQVTGISGDTFNLVVTRGADFTTQPTNSLATAQNITATEQSGSSKRGGCSVTSRPPTGAITTQYRQKWATTSSSPRRLRPADPTNSSTPSTPNCCSTTKTATSSPRLTAMHLTAETR